MTTDKVRVEILKIKGHLVWDSVHIIYGGGVLKQSVLVKDRDNWIDITLPEPIDGEKEFEVNIRYRDNKWESYMHPIRDRHLQNDANSRYANIYDKYELQVTAY